MQNNADDGIHHTHLAWQLAQLHADHPKTLLAWSMVDQETAAVLTKSQTSTIIKCFFRPQRNYQKHHTTTELPYIEEINTLVTDYFGSWR